MKPQSFPQQSYVLGRPEGMTDDECEVLPVWTDGHECASLWRPTLRERLSILLFGRVWLRVVSGRTQPPVLVEGRRTIFKLTE